MSSGTAAGALLEVGLLAYVCIALLAAHALAVARRDRSTLTVLLALDLVAAVLVATAYFAPQRFRHWMQEDGWAEWATVFAFALAAVLAVAELRRNGAARGETARWPRWLAFGGIALFCLFVAAEEISWGQRLLGFKPPEAFLEHNYQQELNVHNLLKNKQVLHFKLDSRYLVALIALVYGLLLPWLARLRKIRELPHVAGMLAALPALSLTPWFAAVALAELVYPVDLTGEAAELGLGLLFLASMGLAGRLPDQRVPTRAAGLAAGAMAVALLAGIVAQPVVQRLLYGEDRAAVAQVERELALLQQDLEQPGVLRRKLRRKGRVHKRLFTAVRAGYLRFGRRSRFLEERPTPAESLDDARRDRRGYFLDPWNNPYWIQKDRRGQITLYSFGPNRRRDADPRRFVAGAVIPGDDLARRFRWVAQNGGD